MLPDPTLNHLSNQELATLVLTTTLPEHIDFIEDATSRTLNGKPELRKALYAVARQNAQHRRALAPDEPLPSVESLNLSAKTITDLAVLLKRTHDSQVVDFIEGWTEARLRRLPEMRAALFEIAREGVRYRTMTGGR